MGHDGRAEACRHPYPHEVMKPSGCSFRIRNGQDRPSPAALDRPVPGGRERRVPAVPAMT